MPWVTDEIPNDPEYCLADIIADIGTSRPTPSSGGPRPGHAGDRRLPRPRCLRAGAWAVRRKLAKNKEAS